MNMKEKKSKKNIIQQKNTQKPVFFECFFYKIDAKTAEIPKNNNVPAIVSFR